VSSIHILTGQGGNLYTAVVHASVPAGNNLAGVSWADAIKGSGLGTTILTVGTAAGQITNGEANAIANGTIIEAVILWQNDPSWTSAQRNADLDLRAQQAIAEKQATLAEQLRLFGATRT
jgi:hypothetical protein